MLNIFMRNIYKSQYDEHIYKTWFEITDSEGYINRNSILGSLTINTQTEKIKLRIINRFKNGEYISLDKVYLLSYEEKVLVLCELFNRLYIYPKKCLPYSIVNFKFIESNRADKDFIEESCTLIGELKKYRYMSNKKSKVIIHILDALAIIEKYADYITSEQKIFVDCIRDLNKKEITVYDQVIFNYFLGIKSSARLSIEPRKKIFKTNYFVTLTKLVEYTASAFPPGFSEWLDEYYKKEDAMKNKD